MKAKLDVAWAEYVKINKEMVPRANFNFAVTYVAVYMADHQAYHPQVYHPQVHDWINRCIEVCGREVTIEFINNDCLVAGCMLFLYTESS